MAILKIVLLSSLLQNYKFAHAASHQQVQAVKEPGQSARTVTSNATGSGACSHHGGVDHWI